jgi:hypothetical protein
MTSKRNPAMFRCRLVRFIDGFPQTVIYVARSTAGRVTGTWL